MKLLIAYGSKGKFFHLNEFKVALEKFGVECKLVFDLDYSNGFPSKKITDWFPNNKFKKLIKEFQPDAIFVDRQSHFGKDAIKNKIPLYVLLRGHYWSEQEWAKKTIHKSIKSKMILWFRNKIAEKNFSECQAIFPICEYLERIVKERYPMKNTFVFLEGVDSSRWYNTNDMSLNHPCVGLLQDANWWGKTKEMMILKEVLGNFPNVTFYWAGDGPYAKKIVEELQDFKNFIWLGRLEYPEKVRDFLSEIDIYALISGMDLAPLTLKEAELMKKPVIGTNVGGIPEMMIDKKTGFLVKEGDSVDLCQKISILINDMELRRKMGSDGRKFVEDNFSWEQIAQKFLKNIKKTA